MSATASTSNVLSTSRTTSSSPADAGRSLGAGDDFATRSDAFPSVPPQFLSAVKLQQVSLPDADGIPRTSVVVDRVLVDLAAVDPALMDAQTIVRDCEFVRDLLLRHPDAPRQLIAAFQADAPTSDIAAAATFVREIGLTEEAAIDAKGGLVFLLFLLAGAVGAAAGAVALNTANGIKYNHAVGRATSKDPNAGIIKGQ